MLNLAGPADAKAGGKSKKGKGGGGTQESGNIREKDRCCRNNMLAISGAEDIVSCCWSVGWSSSGSILVRFTHPCRVSEPLPGYLA